MAMIKLRYFEERVVKFYYALRRGLVLINPRLLYFRKGKPAVHFKPERVSRILIFSVGLIGDTVMCLPAFSEIRRLFPAATICAIVNSTTRSLLQSSPYIDEFMTYDYSAFPIILKKQKILNSLLEKTKGKNFDVAFVFHGDDFVPFLYRAHIPTIIGIKNSFFGFLLTHTYSIGDPASWAFQERLNALRSLGFKPSMAPPRIFISDESRKRVSEILIKNNYDTEKKIILIHPFGNGRYKWWPMQKVLTLLKLAEEYKDILDIFIIGGKKEQLYLLRNFPEISSSRINLSGQLTINELCALIERCCCIITTDSGPLHLAGVLEKPVIGLFRAISSDHENRYKTVIPLKWPGPAYCLDGCGWNRCKKLPCCQMDGIESERVFLAIKEILKEKDNEKVAVSI